MLGKADRRVAGPLGGQLPQAADFFARQACCRRVERRGIDPGIDKQGARVQALGRKHLGNALHPDGGGRPFVHPAPPKAPRCATNRPVGTARPIHWPPRSLTPKRRKSTVSSIRTETSPQPAARICREEHAMEPQQSPANMPVAKPKRAGSKKASTKRHPVNRQPEVGAGLKPAPTSADGDFYKVAQLVGPADQALLRRVRAFAEGKVAPIINQYWGRAEFPFDLIRDYGALGIAGLPYKGFGCRGASTLLDGLIMLELARIDCSIATFHGVHSGLAMGSIYLCGSKAQKGRWLPAMQRAEKIGAFGLTEPEVGSGAARGLTTTAERRGKDWILNGHKRWIGNATFADL